MSVFSSPPLLRVGQPIAAHRLVTVIQRQLHHIGELGLPFLGGHFLILADNVTDGQDAQGVLAGKGGVGSLGRASPSPRTVHGTPQVGALDAPR